MNHNKYSIGVTRATNTTNEEKIKIGKLAEFCSGYNTIITSATALLIFISFSIIWRYCIDNGIPFFQAASDLGISAITLTILGVMLILYMCLMYSFPALLIKEMPEMKHKALEITSYFGIGLSLITWLFINEFEDHIIAPKIIKNASIFTLVLSIVSFIYLIKNNRANNGFRSNVLYNFFQTNLFVTLVFALHFIMVHKAYLKIYKEYAWLDNASVFVITVLTTFITPVVLCYILKKKHYILSMALSLIVSTFLLGCIFADEGKFSISKILIRGVGMGGYDASFAMPNQHACTSIMSEISHKETCSSENKLSENKAYIVLEVGKYTYATSIEHKDAPKGHIVRLNNNYVYQLKP